MLEKSKKIKIFFTKDKITKQTKLLKAIKKYPSNPILIINNKCILPNGWLEMFINDHIKYPKDAIVANIQFYFGKKGEINEISEGIQGKYGTFNHVTEIIFNFALINIDFGGILYPKNFFNNSLFYDENIFLKSSENSEEFWQSAFIIMEDKILRQSSKIFDFSKYLISEDNSEANYINKKSLFERIKLTFISQFPNFDNFIKKRQNKIIVSITSYPERFNLLPELMVFLRNQTFHINRVILFIYKEDYKLYNLNITDVEIILTDKDIRPHKKYYYAMKFFRDNAIITLDDDMIYESDLFESFFNAYIENPN